MTETESMSSTGDDDPHFYHCGRLLGMNKAVVILIFASALFGAWNLKEKLPICEEEPGLFVFQFKTKAERDQIYGGGPWFFSGIMLVLAAHDELIPIEVALLNHLEVWVLVAGLQIARGMRRF